mgnify:FL=1|jgi:hypothetical protein
MRYIIFVIDGPGNPANADEMKHIDAFNKKLQNNGHWVMAAGIQQASGATLIDNRNNKNLVEQASLFTGTDSYSGFWIIEAESDEQAKELAVEASFCCNRRVELRAYLR